MESEKLMTLSKGQLIDEAANSIELLAARTRTRPEFYRNLVRRLRNLSSEVELADKGDGTSPKDFLEAYEKLGNVPDGLKDFVARAYSDSVNLTEQMPPPDLKIEQSNKKPRKYKKNIEALPEGNKEIE